MHITNLRIKTYLKLAKISLVTACFATTIAAQVPGDYDGDGKADLSVAAINASAKTTQILVRSSSNGAPLSYSFGVAAEAVVTGRWFSDTKSYPGIVYSKGAGVPLTWAIRNPQGTDNSFDFGLPGDVIPNIAFDLDGDGITDPVVTRNGFPGHYDGFKLWYVALSGSGGAILETVFGLAKDKAYVGQDVGGLGRLYVLRDDFTWYGRSLTGTEDLGVQWGLPGDTAIAPQVIAGQVAYVVTRSFPTGNVAFIRYSNGVTQSIFLGSAGATPILGNFFGLGNDFALHNKSTAVTSVRFPDGTFAGVPVGSAGQSAFAPIGHFEKSSSNASSVGSCTNITSISDLPGILYKPINEHGGRGPTMIFQAKQHRTGKSSLEIRDSNCVVIGRLGLQSAVGQYGERFYSRSGNGTKYSHTELHNLAIKSAGSPTVLIQGKGDLWIKINDPEDRQGRL